MWTSLGLHIESLYKEALDPGFKEENSALSQVSMLLTERLK